MTSKDADDSDGSAPRPAAARSHPTPGHATPHNALPRIATIFVVAAGVVITMIGARELSWLINPLLLAIVIVILVYPVYQGLQRLPIPRVLAIAGLLLAVYGVILGLIAIVVYSLGRLATVLPDYLPAATATIGQLTTELGSIGIGTDQLREIGRSLDLARVSRWLTAQIPKIAGLAANLVFLYSLLLFLALESTQIRHRMAPTVADHPRLAQSLTGFVIKTRRYIAVTGLFAIIVGGLDTVLLLILGVPLAPLWGLLAAACNFIPYVGFIIGLVPPALLVLLERDWQSMLLLIIVYVLLNSVITTLLPAKFVGNAVDMSMTLTMLSVGFWAWVLGPFGAVLAIPLSLLIKAVLIDADPSARWLGGFLDAAPSKRRSPP